MQTTKSFESEALRANLERTRAQAAALPERHAMLLEAMSGHYGVQKRLRHFLEEYHHRYPNRDWIVTQLRMIMLQDFWYYRKHGKSGTLLRVLFEISDELLRNEAPIGQHRRVFQTLLECAELCAEAEEVPGDDEVIPFALEVLERSMAGNRQLSVVAGTLLRSISSHLLAHDGYQTRLTGMLYTALAENLRYWKDEAPVESILEDHGPLLTEGRERLLGELGSARFSELARRHGGTAEWGALEAIPDYHAVAERFRTAAEFFSSPLQRACYLTAILPLSGLAHLQEQLLWDLNIILRGLLQEANREEIPAFLDDLFHMLTALRGEHMNTVLECLMTCGTVICKNDDPVLIEHFTLALIDFGFVHPNIHGVDEDWQIRRERDHVKNIRIWLEIIKSNPRRSARLLSALIIHLKLGGVFVEDNDLFQRDVTALLNSDIRPLMFLVKQLAILFPVYFNEIGAEGELREISTVIDEISGRRDRLIHFLRKQIHAESNNTHLQLTEVILRYWMHREDDVLAAMLPEDVFNSLAEDAAWHDAAHTVVRQLARALSCEAEELPAHTGTLLSEAAATHFDTGDVHVARVLHLCRIHQLLRRKYSIDVEDIIPQMEKLHVVRNADIEEFRMLRGQDNPERTLEFVLGMLRRLHEVILDETPSQASEEIYYKRHIAAGIPSMYGRYMEPKFQALGLVFRFEALATQLKQRIVEETNLRYITAATLRRIHRILVLFRSGLEIEGYSDEGFSSSVEMLRFGLSTTSFTIHQYINLFRFLADNVKSIIHSNFITPHETQLLRILPQYLSDGGNATEKASESHAASERLYRDLISTTYPIQQLDNFIAAVLSSMNDMLRHLTPDVIQGVMGYDSRLVTTRLYQSNQELDNPVFLGAKGYYLKRLLALGFPVPPGFIMTTELFRRRDAINRHPDMKAEVHDLLRRRLRNLEKISDERFGDPDRPLLLSVRSGAAISIPGAMNTFLNVGLNDTIVEGLSRRENYGWTSWDCYRRFLQTWGMVQGIPRDDFDAVMVAFKDRCGVKLKIDFNPEQMRSIAFTYKQVLFDHGVTLEEDPFDQLLQAVLMVLDSWYTDRARVYRSKLQIAEDWGTAVVVQRMVLGNLNDDSGSGVVFTHDPFIRETGVTLYGDFTVCSQGEDIVAGLVHTLPISERQRLRSQAPDTQSLEKDFPGIYRQLERYANAIVEEHNFGHQEIEFTFEKSNPADLYILQTRDHSPMHEREIPVFEDEALDEKLTGSGIGIGGGAMNGFVCFDHEDLQHLRGERPGAHLVLVRPDTVPDDIGMIFECDGLLTARGGATSHAAVTAVRLRKTCVVDCRAMQVDEGRKECIINGVPFRTGDAIAIDGRMGSIYRGILPISYVQVQRP
jgi:pyruvate, orthophosphate dikinase